MSFLAACSLINSFDDVKDAVVDAGSAADAPVVVPPIEAGPLPDSGPVSDAAVDAGPAGPTGAIVVGANVVGDAGKEFVLTVLNPATGAELAPSKREKMKVAAIQYDGLRDLWYIFESLGTDFQPSPVDPVTLHVRELNNVTGEWTERQKLAVPTVSGSDVFAVLRNRIAYFAYVTTDAGIPEGKLVLLDTTTPSAVTVLTPNTDLDAIPEGIIGTRVLSGTGGTLTLIRKDSPNCSGTSAPTDFCPWKAQTVTIVPGASPQFGAGTQPIVANVVRIGSPAWGSYLGGNVNIFGVPAAAGQSAYLESRLTSTNLTSGTATPFALTGSVLRPLAISECAQTAFVAELTSGELRAVPLAAGSTVLEKNLGHPGQRLFFEPFSNSLLAPFKTANSFEISAYTLGGTKTVPTLTKRQAPGWNPPADLQPNVVAVKAPVTFACP